MKKKLLASGLLVALFAIASPALADSDKNKRENSVRVEGHAGLHLGAVVSALAHERNEARKERREERREQVRERRANDTSTTTASAAISGRVAAINALTLTVTNQNGTTYAVNASGASITNRDRAPIAFSDVKVGDFVVARGNLVGTVMIATSIKDMGAQFDTAAAYGTIASVSGSSFVINPIAPASSSTTVNVGAGTIFRGLATSSASLAAGHYVLVVGTSTSANTISGSLVIMFEEGFAFLKHLFRNS